MTRLDTTYAIIVEYRLDCLHCMCTICSLILEVDVIQYISHLLKQEATNLDSNYYYMNTASSEWLLELLISHNIIFIDLGSSMCIQRLNLGSHCNHTLSYFFSSLLPSSLLGGRAFCRKTQKV